MAHVPHVPTGRWLAQVGFLLVLLGFPLLLATRVLPMPDTLPLFVAYTLGPVCVLYVLNQLAAGQPVGGGPASKADVDRPWWGPRSKYE
ncbi:MAG TPA: hypothetical protein VE953_11995 [Terriglobales bacterium]|nr:hypothetical protein [Terriglobales bacterium]